MINSIDLDYRPAGYFRLQPLEDHVLSRVKGALVKKRLRELLASNEHDEVARLLREHGVPEEECRALGSVHPLLMGGNYLPGSDHGEVEIARIFIHSTTGDVTAVYARMAGPEIHYRVVDEYGGETLQGRITCESTRPLTLGELYQFFTRAWPFYEVLDANFEGDTEQMLGFFVAESNFYPQLDLLCRLRVMEAFPLVEKETE